MAFRREAEVACQAHDREQQQRDTQWQLRCDTRDEQLHARIMELERVCTRPPPEEEAAAPPKQSMLWMLAPSSKPSRPAPPTTREYTSMTTLQGVENILGSNYMERLAQETRARPTDARHLFIGEDELSYCVPNETHHVVAPRALQPRGAAQGVRQLQGRGVHSRRDEMAARERPAHLSPLRSGPGAHAGRPHHRAQDQWPGRHTTASSTTRSWRAR